MATYVPKRPSAIFRTGYEVGFLVNGFWPNGIERPEVVIGIVPSLSGGGLAALLSRRYQIPFGLIFQDIMGAATLQSGIPGGRRIARITRELEGLVARQAERIAVISPGFVDYLAGLSIPKERIVHVRNWSHLPLPTTPRDQTRGKMGWKSEDIVVLHAGAMGFKQGLENVVETAQRAATALPRAKFVLMGEGSQRSALETMAIGMLNINFLPPCTRETLPDVLAAADILIVNERATVSDMSLPSKLTSYMVAGRPIVASVPPDGFTAREVDHSEAGIVVPPNQPDALLHAISMLSSDTDLADQLGGAGIRYVASTLSPGSILPKLTAFVTDVLMSRQA
jgi:glycosyltransferase involved in cell wall biosynthesis